MGIFMNEHAETLLSIMFVLSLLWLIYCLLLRIYIEPAYNYLVSARIPWKRVELQNG
jgi:preprotein translocase subunit SecG